MKRFGPRRSPPSSPPETEETRSRRYVSRSRTDGRAGLDPYLSGRRSQASNLCSHHAPMIVRLLGQGGCLEAAWSVLQVLPLPAGYHAVG